MSERSISPYERYGAARPLVDSSLQIYVFTATDTISSIAEKYLGDWRLWRIIAERNNIIDPRQIQIGTQLIVPRRPIESGIYEEK